MNEQIKGELILEATSIKRRAAQHIVFLQQVIRDIDAEIHRLENMIPPLVFQKDITGEEDRNALVMVSAIGSSLAHIRVTITMLRNQRLLAESCLKNAEPIPGELSEISTALGFIPNYEE